MRYTYFNSVSFATTAVKILLILHTVKKMFQLTAFAYIMISL